MKKLVLPWYESQKVYRDTLYRDDMIYHFRAAVSGSNSLEVEVELVRPSNVRRGVPSAIFITFSSDDFLAIQKMDLEISSDESIEDILVRAEKLILGPVEYLAIRLEQLG